MSKLLLFLAIFLLSVYADIDLTGFTIIGLQKGSYETTIKVSKGELFALKIESNPTTGFGWYLMNRSELESSNVLVALDKENSGEYQSDFHREGEVGFGGHSYFKFKGISRGSSIVRLYYMTIWDKNTLYKLQVKVCVV